MHAVIAACAVAAGCDDGTSEDRRPQERVVVAEGRNLHLGRLDAEGLVQMATATIPPEGLLEAHVIFGIIKHPTQPWLYVSSANGCESGADWCWGNARIDRFRIDQDGITYMDELFTYDETAAEISGCSGDEWGYPGQVGSCAPLNGVFSPDGTRLYMTERSNEMLDIFEVASDGALTLLWEGEHIEQHGLAMHPTEPYLYNGAHVIDVAEDEGDTIAGGAWGNDASFLPAEEGGDDLLLTTLNSAGVSLYSLADPTAPIEVDALNIASNAARSVAINAARTRLVTVGRNTVTTIGFDGTSLAVEDSVDLSGGVEDVENRSVALLDDGNFALVAWFQDSEANASGLIGGVTLYSIDPEGTLTEVDTLPFGRSARAVKTLVLP